MGCGERPFYVEDEAEAQRYRRRLKQIRCPHCDRIGFLNCHGFLRGFAEGGNGRTVRGWRVYCRNRDGGGGCGRTHSILLASVLCRRQLRAPRLWKFLSFALRGLSRRAAWRRAGAPFSTRHAYRIWARIERGLGALGAALCRIIDPPESAQTDPLLQVFEHLGRALAPAPCAITAFQARFQTGFLS